MAALIWTIWSYTYYALLGTLLTLLALFLHIVILQLHRISTVPPNIPWVGLKDRTFFPKLRACLDELTGGRSMSDEGYEKYGKHDKPFVMPGMTWNAVVLPPSQTGWIARQPDSILSGNKVLDDTLGLDFLTNGPSADSCRDFTVIRRDLTRQLVQLTEQISDEVVSTLSSEIGPSTEYKPVAIQDVVNKVTFRTMNRIFVGLPLCRSQAYEKAVEWWSVAYGVSMLVMRNLVPQPWKKFIMPFVAVPAKLTEWWAVSYLTPKIRQRQRALSTTTGRPYAEGENDMMQWIINENARKADPAEMKPASIAGKMLLFNIFSSATTSLILGALLFKISIHEDAVAILAELREEADRIMPYASQDGRLLRDMVKLDSVIRETLRYYPLGAQGLIREVVNPGGIETPDGLFLPEGTHVHTIVSTMQRDPSVHGDDAAEFDPWRYCRQDRSDSKPEADALETKKIMAVQIREDYLSFGLGKHACPGRFLAIHVIKLVLGHLLTQYDVEPPIEQQTLDEFAGALIPSSKNMVKFRKRVDIRVAPE